MAKTDDVAIRRIICEWPGIAVGFCQYSGGEVAVAIAFDNHESFGSVLGSLPAAVEYARKSVRFARLVFKAKGQK